MLSVEDILGLDKPLFCDTGLVDTKDPPPLPFHEMDRLKDELKASKAECQFQKDTVAKLEKDIKEMKKLLEDCQQVKLEVVDKKEYSENYLIHLNKSNLMKKSELQQLKHQIKSSARDEAKVAKQKMSKVVFEQLFGVKIRTKYSNTETIALVLKKKSEEKGVADKENYVQIPNKSEKAWELLESRNKAKISEMKTAQNKCKK
ncbi:hypothetical protein WDU94_006511 [Cyamophila willieti]